MQCMLNFSQDEKRKAREILAKFPARETNTLFEEARCAVGKSVVTLYTSGKLVIQGNDCSAVKEKILLEMGLRKEIVLGIDETGRGESSGPFVVTAVLGDSSELRELRDSKKTGDIEAKRGLVEEKALAIGTISISPQWLDELRRKGATINGIEAEAINSLHGFFSSLEKGARTVVDGDPLKGSDKKVEFLVKGDDKNAVVGAASVVAKSERDRSANKRKREHWGK
ncbi:MAG: hypothetical protein NTW59_04150 [Candidatus Diapherotrites archaeon]|nr:hypothetical protein [Candidatus Diapherotrites archaeon]